MRWPLVWRSTFDLAQADATAYLTSATEEWNKAVDLKNQLFEREQIHEDRQAGSRRQIAQLEQENSSLNAALKGAIFDGEIRVADNAQLYAEIQRLNAQIAERDAVINGRQMAHVVETAKRKNAELMVDQYAAEVKELTANRLVFTNPESGRKP